MAWRISSALVVVLADVAIATYIIAGVSSSRLPYLAGRDQRQSDVVATSVPAAASPVPLAPHPETPTSTVAPATTHAARPESTVPTLPAPKTAQPQSALPPAITTPPPAPPQSSLRANALPVVTVPDAEVDLPPSPDFLQFCGSPTANTSWICTGQVVDAINNARSVEGLLPMTLPTNWAALNPAEQLFVATNLEREARGLTPLSAMSSVLDAAATRAAIAGGDPSPPTGFPASTWGGNLAQAVGSPLEVLYYWIYDDGPASPNITCSAAHPGGCFGHRRNIFLPLACTPCVAGASWVQTPQDDRANATELIVGTSGSPTVDFTWADEQPYLSADNS